MQTNIDGIGALAVHKWRGQFSKLRDTRRRKGKRHRLVDVVLMSLIAMLCGCDDADEIAVWCQMRSEELEKWFGFKHGPPSQDTILRVFAMIKPKPFSIMVAGWLRSLRLIPDTGQICVDGKTLRGSLERGGEKRAVHLVSAWMGEVGILLGQLKTDDKSNEITAIPELLATLDLSGHTVSIDAAGCQKAIAEQIVDQGGDYLLAVKENQPRLYGDIDRSFAESRNERNRTIDELERPHATTAEHVDSGHGRIEERRATVCRDLQQMTTLDDWPGLSGVGLVESITTDKRTGKISTESRRYILSNPDITAEEFLEQTREHWSVESMHWVMDVEFREDASRITERRAAENFGLLRRTALGLLKATPLPENFKRMSYKNRRRWCDGRPEYLLRVLLANSVRATN